MAARLKDFFDERIVRVIARDLRAAHDAFDDKAFARTCLAGLADLELTARGWHIAEAMQKHLPTPFAKAADVVEAALGPECSGTESFGLEPFRYMPHAYWVSKYGLEHFDRAMALQYEITKRFTAEFSVRPFLVTHEKKTLAKLSSWASDSNVHVRRLVSEATRPRLPWAQRLRAFQQDPSPVLALLENLKDDPERYVQRSVANNLNDIAKDHPDLAVEVARRWLTDATPARRWVVEHALRLLVKQGHRGALDVLGFGEKPKVRLASALLSSKKVKLGGQLSFSFELVSTSKRRQELVIDYAVHFMKANGVARPKVFKLRKLVLPSSASVELAAKVSFVDLTTRRHHPGAHRLEVLVNGVAFPLADFDVR